MSVMRNKLLQINDGAESFESCKCAIGQVGIADPQNASPFTAKQGFDDDVSAKHFPSSLSVFGELTDPRARSLQTCGSQLGKCKVFVDGSFECTWRIDDHFPPGRQLPECIHSKDNLFQRT